MRDEFLTRRRLGNREKIAGDCEQKTQARFQVSRAKPGAIQQGYGEGIVIRLSLANFLN
jgi:hypothetical protein